MQQPTSHPTLGSPHGASAWRTHGLRRRLAALGVGVLVALLGGCQTQPSHPAPRAQQEAALRSLGFVKSGDGWVLSLAAPIQFDVDKDALKPQIRKAVDDVAQTLRRVGIERVRVEGHTDNFGGRDYNLDLSRRRAEVVAHELAQQGLSDATIVRRAWAFDYPVASNDTPEGRAQNRRVTIVVLAPDLSAD